VIAARSRASRSLARRYLKARSLAACSRSLPARGQFLMSPGAQFRMSLDIVGRRGAWGDGAQ
jgi:hypothetical protein